MKTITPEMQKIINARVAAIEDGHANNLISGLDMGQEWFDALIERAREPISNEVFTIREKEIFDTRYPVSKD